MVYIFFSTIVMLLTCCVSSVCASEVFRLSQPAQCCSDDDTSHELVRFMVDTDDVKNFRGTYSITASGTFSVSMNRTAHVDLQVGNATLASFISGDLGDSIPWSISINATIRSLPGLGPELYVTGIISVNNEEKAYIYPLEVVNYSAYDFEMFPFLLKGQITGGVSVSSDYIKVSHFLIALD